MTMNTDIKKHVEANALINSTPRLCDLPVAFRNNAQVQPGRGRRREPFKITRLQDWKD